MAAEPDLSRLILDAKGDRSYERMSLDCGGLPTDKRLQQMATTPLKAFPDVATIRGLARGTGTTETAVVLAAARSLGLRVHSGVDPTALVIGGADDLRPEQKEAVTALVRVFREMNGDSRRRRLEAALGSSEQRYDATNELIATVPIDGPDRTRERAIITRAAIEALTELELLEQDVPAGGLPMDLVDRLAVLRHRWQVAADGLIEMTAKYPPFADGEDVTRDNLNRVIHGVVQGVKGSGKTAAHVRKSDRREEINEALTRIAREGRSSELNAYIDDYDAEAAHVSPEPAGLPEPESP